LIGVAIGLIGVAIGLLVDGLLVGVGELKAKDPPKKSLF